MVLIDRFTCEFLVVKILTFQVCNKDGFRCGRQCVPKELVCDGKHDCLDGSDEDDCSSKN
jgi:hypothetical protein